MCVSIYIYIENNQLQPVVANYLGAAATLAQAVVGSPASASRP
jgi:hypothetical protein